MPGSRGARPVVVIIAVAVSFLLGVGVCFYLEIRREQALTHARGVTTRTFARTGRFFKAWHEMYGRYPDPDLWQDQDEVKRNRGETYHREDFLDGWGHLLKYKLVKKNGCEQYLLYSTGPDGLDFQGRGDDMVYPIGGYPNDGS